MEKRTKKKDFKFSEDLMIEFERLAPSGKQTKIVESLIAEWVSKQQQSARKKEVTDAYERDARGKEK